MQNVAGLIMGIKRIPAGANGYDYIANIPAQTIVNNGGSYVVRYISIPPANPAKNIRPSERDELLAAGVGIGLVFEVNATRALQGGAVGYNDGIASRNILTNLGYPLEVPVLVAVDTNIQGTDIAVAKLYVVNFANAVRPWRIGVYGDAEILLAVGELSELGWYPVASAWSTPEAKSQAAKLGLIHVQQRHGPPLDGLYSVDYNTTLQAVTLWGTETTESDTTMPPIATNSEARTYAGVSYPPLFIKWVIMPDGTLRHVQETEYKAYKGKSSETSYSNSELDSFPPYAPGTGGGSHGPLTVTSTVTSTVSEG